MILCKSFDTLSRARALKRALTASGVPGVRIYRDSEYWVVEWTA